MEVLYLENRLKRISGALPALMLVAALGGFCLTLALRRYDLSIFSLVLVVPLAAAALFILASKKTEFAGFSSFAPKPGFSILLALNLLFFSASVISLFLASSRPFSYFILIAACSGLLFLQIISIRPGWTDGLIVGQIVLLSLNLVWGTSLKYPLYFGDTDLLVHLNLINTIVNTGHVAAYNIDYLHYPLYHIFAAMGVEITEGSIRFLLFILMGLAWQIGTVFAFLIFLYISRSSKLSLTACLLYTLSSQTIFYGSYSIARSLAFVFFVCWIYFILKAGKDKRYFFLSLLALPAMIITHHLNVLYTIPVLALVYVCQLALGKFSHDRPLELLFVYLLTISAVAYMIWIAANMTGSTLPVTIRSMLSETGIKSGSTLTHGFGTSVIFGTLYYSFAFFLALLGIKRFIDLLEQRSRFPGTFVLTGIISLVLYVPGFMYLFPFSDVLLTDRIILIVSPFVALLMAYGLDYLCRLKTNRTARFPQTTYRVLMPAVLLSATTFFSMVSIGNAKDTNYFPHTANVDSPYFTASELGSFSFLTVHADKTVPLYADYATTRNAYMLSAFEDRTIITAGQLPEIHGAYVLLRTGELQQKQSLGFLPAIPEGIEIVRYPASQLIPEMSSLNNSAFANKIFSGNSVWIYLTKAVPVVP